MTSQAKGEMIIYIYLQVKFKTSSWTKDIRSSSEDFRKLRLCSLISISVFKCIWNELESLLISLSYGVEQGETMTHCL